MRTIPNRFPRKRPGGDYRDVCYDCRAEYHRSAMTMGPDGNLRCNDTCADGRELYELGRESVDAAKGVGRRRSQTDWRSR